MWVALIVITVMSYIWFLGDECGLNIGLITVTIVLCVGLSILSISPVVEHGSLLTSSAMSLYFTYLGWSALTS